MHAGFVSSPVFPGLEQLVCFPLGSGLCDTVLLLYLERVTHPHSPLSSSFILVNEADGGLEFKKRRCSTEEKSQFWNWEQLLGRSHALTESSRDECHGQCEAQQSSARK